MEMLLNRKVCVGIIRIASKKLSTKFILKIIGVNDNDRYGDNVFISKSSFCALNFFVSVMVSALRSTLSGINRFLV